MKWITNPLNSQELSNGLSSCLDLHFVKGEKEYNSNGGCCIVSNVYNRTKSPKTGLIQHTPWLAFRLSYGRYLSPANLQPYWMRLRTPRAGGVVRRTASGVGNWSNYLWRYTMRLYCWINNCRNNTFVRLIDIGRLRRAREEKRQVKYVGFNLPLDLFNSISIEEISEGRQWYSAKPYRSLFSALVDLCRSLEIFFSY